MQDAQTRQTVLANARRQRSKSLFVAAFIIIAYLLSGALNEPEARGTALGIVIIVGGFFLFQAFNAHLHINSLERGEDVDPHVFAWICEHQTLSDRQIDSGLGDATGAQFEPGEVRAALDRLAAKGLISKLAPDLSAPEMTIWTVTSAGANEYARIRAQAQAAAAAAEPDVPAGG